MKLQPFSLIDVNGRVLVCGVSEEIPEHPERVLTVNGLPPDSNHYWCFTDNQWKARPACPNQGYVFNWENKQWEDPRGVKELQAEYLAAVEKEKVARKAAPIFYDDHLVDAHTTAQTNIANKLNELNAIEALGLSVESVALYWRVADNSTVVFDSLASMKAWLLGLVIAISRRASEIYSWSWAQKEKIRSSTSKEELEALEWSE